MNQRNLIRSAVRGVLITGAAVAAAGYASTASAAKAANTPAQLGKVTVTGSRIKRTNLETGQPVVRISRQQIQTSGYTNVSELIKNLSFTGGTEGSGTPGRNGVSEINLRGFGSLFNLVLVNGQRWPSSQFGVTNLNIIPPSIIDHIEILKDGASAVYGSDAITGVINIITVKNFQGAVAHAHYGIQNGDGHWDGQEKQYDFTVGSGNDRGNVVFNATYRERNPISNNARKLTRHPIAGIPDGLYGSSTTPRGRFRLFGPAADSRAFGQGTCGTFDSANPANTLCDFTLSNAPAQPSSQNFRNYLPTDAYNNARHEQLQIGTKDVSLYMQGHYDLFDNVTFTTNATYVRDEAVRQMPPDPIQVGLLSSKTANGQKIGIAATNPYNPFGVDLVADSSDPCLATGGCVGLSELSRLPVGTGGRRVEFNRDEFHIFAGFNGFINLFNREIDWDVGFAQNRRQIVEIDQNVFNLVNLKNALGPVSQCTSPCVPLNLFGGPGTITQDQASYIQYEPHNITQNNLRDWTANISSDVYDLPAGPLGVAIGWERIDNYYFSHPDAVRVQGNDNDANSSAQNGRIVRNAEYAELNIPLLADVPGAKSLSVDIANRWTQFDRSGGITGQSPDISAIHNSSGRLNIRYQPITDLLLRASWAQGFKSPTITELFGGQSVGTTGLTDPCAPGPYGGYIGGPLPANCPNGTLDVQPNSSVRSFGGANPNLQPIKSLSRSVGFVYSPSQLPGLDVSADYFKIELSQREVGVGVGNIINGCFNFSVFCDQLSVSNNQIVSVHDIRTNNGSTLAEGIDFGINYKFPSTPYGDFAARVTGTFVKAFDQSTINQATKTGFATSHLAGAGGYPRRRFNGELNWDYGNWNAQYRIEYIGSETGQCSVQYEGYCNEPNNTANYQGVPGVFTLGRQRLGAVVYHDVNVGYTIPLLDTTFNVGVNNLFDKQPPITGGGGLDFFDYRLPSRLVYGDIRVKF